MARLSDEPGDRPLGARGSSFVALWIIVTGLWTAATVLRMQRVWAPIMGWPTILASVYTWVSLLLPPWMFAIIMLAIKRVVMGRQRPDG